MNGSRNRTLALALFAIAAAALGAGCSSTTWPHGMQASLYMQTSAEYEALCWQTYRQAWDAVSARAQENSTKADDQGHTVIVDAATGKQLCVIMDMDETVLDNSAYQDWLYRTNRKNWDQASWTHWLNEKWDTIKVVPGAAEFIQQCEALGVRVIFISGRLDAERPGTLKTLKAHGILLDGCEDPAALRMLLKAKASDSNDKTARRAAIAERYFPIAFFGDNLSDFDDEFAAKKTGSVKARQTLALAERQHFGVDWFVLPNPLYGDWLNVIDGEHPLDSLNAGR